MKLSKKYKRALLNITDERSNGDGWFFYLKPPLWNDELECRIIHEQKFTDCYSQLKIIVDKNITR